MIYVVSAQPYRHSIARCPTAFPRVVRNDKRPEEVRSFRMTGCAAGAFFEKQ